jgi:hypothetical protein
MAPADAATIPRSKSRLFKSNPIDSPSRNSDAVFGAESVPSAELICGKLVWFVVVAEFRLAWFVKNLY